MNARVELSETPIGPSADAPAGTMGVRDLWIVFLSRRRLFLTALTVTVALVGLVTLLMTPLYTSTASVVIDTRRTDVVDIQAVLSGPGIDASVTDTESQVIASRALIEKAAERVGLFEDEEFNPALADPRWTTPVVDAIKAVGAAAKSPFSRPRDAALAERMARAKVLDRVVAALSIKRAGVTYVINISASTRAPQKSADLANALAEEYIRQQLESKIKATRGANTWLNEQLITLKKEVQRADSAVEAYRKQSGLLSAKGTTLTEQQIAELNARLIVQRSDYQEREARLNEVRLNIDAGIGVDSISEALASEVIRSLRNNQADLARRQADMEARYGPRHPDFVNAQHQAADLQKQIDAEVQRIVTNLENEANVSRRRVEALKSSLAGVRDQLSGNNQSEVKLRELERDADANRAMYESFLRRFKQTGDQAEIVQPDAHIVSAAQIASRASWPNKLLSLALSLVLGAGIGVALIVLAEMFDMRLRTGEEVERRLRVPHLGSVPRLDHRRSRLERWLGRRPQSSRNPQDYLVDKPLSSFAEVFRSIRSSLRRTSQPDGPKVLAITSALPDEGQASVAFCLARAMAMAGVGAILVDTDLRQRSLSRLLRVKPAAGLLEVLSGQATAGECIVKDSKTSLAILPLAGIPAREQDVLGSARFGALIKTLSAQYGAIILNVPPLLAVADAQTAARHVDAVIVVVEWNRTASDAVSGALDILHRAGAKFVGVVLNEADPEYLGRFAYRDAVSHYRQDCKDCFAD